MLTRYDLGYIKFYPQQGREFFDEYQLVHVAPNWDIDNKRGFVWAWNKKKDIVRTVEYEQFNEKNTSKITITIDLDQKTITLDKIENLSATEIEDSLYKYFEKKDDNNFIFKKIKIFFIAYLKQIIYIVSGGLILAWIIYKIDLK